MKRNLTLIRHAKSSWDSASLSDFERTLNDRGVRDAPRIGRALQQHKVSADSIIASPAQRVQETAALLLPAAGLSADDVIWLHSIYEANQQDLLEIISKTDDRCENLWLIGHNPTISQTANALAPDDEPLHDLPTCAAVVIEFDAPDWTTAVSAGGKRRLLLTPKTLD